MFNVLLIIAIIYFLIVNPTFVIVVLCIAVGAVFFNLFLRH